MAGMKVVIVGCDDDDGAVGNAVRPECVHDMAGTVVNGFHHGRIPGVFLCGLGLGLVFGGY